MREKLQHTNFVSWLVLYITKIHLAIIYMRFVSTKISAKMNHDWLIRDLDKGYRLIHRINNCSRDGPLDGSSNTREEMDTWGVGKGIVQYT